MFRGGKTQKGQIAPFQILRITDDEAGGVVGPHRSGQLAPEISAQPLGFLDTLAEAADVLRQGITQGYGYRMLAVGPSYLGYFGVGTG